MRTACRKRLSRSFLREKFRQAATVQRSEKEIVVAIYASIRGGCSSDNSLNDDVHENGYRRKERE
jgi:hypothetical protein